MSGAATHEHVERRAHREALVERLHTLYPGGWALLLVRLCSPSAPHEHRGQSCRGPGKVPIEGGGWNTDALARFARDDEAGREKRLAVVSAHLADGGNVGLALPGGTLALDTDTAESTAAVAGMVPYNTPRAKTARGAHYVFALPAGFEATATTDADLGAGLRADLRVGGRSQLAVEPSVHASGARYGWSFGLPENLEEDLPELPAELRVRLERAGALRRKANGEAPPEAEGAERAGELPEGVSAEDWRAAVERLAAAWPEPGEKARHAAYLALAGALLRSGWQRALVVRFLRDLARARRDDTPAEDLEKAALSSARQLEARGRVTGWATLRKICGEAAVSTARQRLGLANEGDASASGETQIRVTALCDVEVCAVRFLWSPYLPLAKVVVLDGDPGVSKTLLAIDLAARITAGRPMPDGGEGVAGSVVFLGYEDDARDTIKPRLLAAGGNPERFHLLDGIEDADGLRPLSIPDDVATIENVVAEVDARLLVVDPLMAALSGEVKSGIDHHVRRALAPLRDLAERCETTVLVIRHLNKNTKESNPLYRGGGSIGIIGAARAGLLLTRDPDDRERRILLATKANLVAEGEARPLAYRVGTDPDHGVAAIAWLGAVEIEQETVTGGARPGPEPRAVQEAVGILNELLVEGPRPAKEVERLLREAGLSRSTIQRAKRRARVRVSEQRGEGGKVTGWAWALPGQGQPRGEPA